MDSRSIQKVDARDLIEEYGLGITADDLVQDGAQFNCHTLQASKPGVAYKHRGASEIIESVSCVEIPDSSDTP